MVMERVPTWVKSPYLGMFQYKNAGPERIHQKATPLLLPASPYLGLFRHDILLETGVCGSEGASKSSEGVEGLSVSMGTQTNVDVSAVATQTSMRTCDVSSQTDMCLTAYVMDGYP